MGMTPKEVLEHLLSLQAREFTYEEFLVILKRRLWRYYGKQEVMFYNEEQLVELLHQGDQNKDRFLVPAK